MDLLTQPPTPPREDAALTQSPEEAADALLKRAVRGLITRLSPLVVRDRRRYARHPMPLLMQLTPVDDEERPVGDPLIVVGKSLSENGIGFFHQHAIPYRHVMVRVGEGAAEELSFLVDLSWCRYTSFGWYESGGRFLKVLEPGEA